KVLPVPALASISCTPSTGMRRPSSAIGGLCVGPGRQVQARHLREDETRQAFETLSCVLVDERFGATQRGYHPGIAALAEAFVLPGVPGSAQALGLVLALQKCERRLRHEG